MTPDFLRTLSPHLALLENQFSDSRASALHPKRLIYDDDPPDD